GRELQHGAGMELGLPELRAVDQHDGEPAARSAEQAPVGADQPDLAARQLQRGAGAAKGDRCVQQPAEKALVEILDSHGTASQGEGPRRVLLVPSQDGAQEADAEAHGSAPSREEAPAGGTGRTTILPAPPQDSAAARSAERAVHGARED